MNFNELARLLNPLRRRIAMLVRRARIKLVNDTHPVQTMQVEIFKGECRNGVERFQEYGFFSVPPEDAEALVAAEDGECAHSFVIGTNDRRYRPRGMKQGDAGLYTLSNRKDEADSEHHIVLDAETRGIRSRGKTFVIDADDMIEIRTSDGKNYIRIGAECGIRITEGGGFDQGGSDIRLKGGSLWRRAANEMNKRTPNEWREEPPSPAGGGTRGPTMPE